MTNRFTSYFIISVFLIVVISGCINSVNTTTTIMCKEYGSKCLSTYDCCKGLYCIKKTCSLRSCGDNICQPLLENIDTCPEDCAPKTQLVSFKCTQQNKRASLNYTSKNPNSEKFYEQPTYELWTDNIMANKTCNPTAQTGCWIYKTGVSDWYELAEANSTHNNTLNINLTQPNQKYPYFNSVPETYWIRLCLSSLNPDTGMAYKGSASCSFIAGTKCQ